MLRYKIFWLIVFAIALISTYGTSFFLPVSLTFVINLFTLHKLARNQFKIVNNQSCGIINIVSNFFVLLLFALFLYNNNLIAFSFIKSHFLLILAITLLMANEVFDFKQRKVIDISIGIILLLIIAYIFFRFNWQAALLSFVLSFIYGASLKSIVDILEMNWNEQAREDN